MLAWSIPSLGNSMCYELMYLEENQYILYHSSVLLI